MFDHIAFGVTDYATSKSFYLKALAPLGITSVNEGSMGIEIVGHGDASLCLQTALHKPAPMHLAFVARSREEVEAFYRAALEGGGKDNGAPGYRPRYHAGYYAAFVLDPDGHNVEAVFHDRQVTSS
ncbi:VOC family protein [Roseateles sp. SL47]|uniref:VOC family protein n=1 Tax=Roseateles sp. SL47 TaxID=2995138 RepID=UPI002271078C|nr:VOC family protein [Roseateles sp. SL47]WAC75028.1 VOC family protein [Roseateles sp. SL47]